MDAGPLPPGRPVNGVARMRDNASGVSGSPIDRWWASLNAASSAPAAAASVPGRSRANAHSQLPCCMLVRGRSCGCIITGAHASNTMPV